MAFKDRLKAARKRSGLTQLDIAKKIGLLNAQSYAQYEQGKRKPKQDTLNKIADALQLGYGYAPNGEPYFYCFVDTVRHGDENEKFNEYQFNDAMSGDSDSAPYIPDTKSEPETTTLAAHFDGDEYTEDELEEIRKFAEFVKSKRKEPLMTKAHKDAE